MPPTTENTRTVRDKLTEVRVEKLRAKAGERLCVMDDGPNAVRGFGVVVFPSGQKTFIARYRTRGTRETSRVRKMRLGTFPEMSVAAARARAGREIGTRDAGGDPADLQAAAKFAPPVETVFPEYLHFLKVGKKLKPRTLEEYERQGRLLILPALGSRKVTEVLTKDIAELHGHTLADRPYLANRVLALLTAFFRWTETRRLRPKDSNPCTEVKAFQEEERERYLSVEELQRLGEALRGALEHGLPPAQNRKAAAERRLATRRAERTAAYAALPARERRKQPQPRKPYKPAKPKLIPSNPFAIAAIRFLALTGWREQEVLSLRWDAVDMESGRVNLKDTKTRQSYRTLSAPAVAVLAELSERPRPAGSPFAFPGHSARQPLTDIKHVWESVREAAGLTDVRLHDLRHNFASYGASALYNLPVISKLLGHKDLASTQRYAHLTDAAVLRAADDIAGGIAAKLDARETPVTPIARARARGHK